MNQLTQRVLLCQKNGEDFNNIYNEILVIVYQYPMLCLKWEEDICAEFLLSFEHKIKKLVYSFKYRNAEFSTYLNNALMWHGKTIQKRKRVESFYRNVSINEYIAESPIEFYSIKEDFREDFSVNEDAIDSIIRLLETIPHGRRTSNSQAFIIYLFSRCQNIDDKVILCLSQFMPLDTDDLFKKLIQLREGLEKRRGKWNHCNKRINTLHCAIEVIKMSLETDLEDSVRYDLEKQLRVKGNLLDNAQKSLSKISLTPSVTMLAKIFKIPRGSVFTAITRVKKLLETLYQNPQLIYPSGYDDQWPQIRNNKDNTENEPQREMLLQTRL